MKFKHSLEPATNINVESRAVPSVALPVQTVLKDTELYGDNSVPNLQRLHEHLRREGRLSAQCVKRIVSDVSKVLAKEQNILELYGTVQVFGAICGQFFDLLEMLKRIDLEKEKLLFLGTYAHGGSFDLETLVYIYTLKLVYPNKVFLLRSNLETRIMAKIKFQRQCLVQYDLSIYESVCHSYDQLPLVAIVNKDTICLHGGISPTALTLAKIAKINRFLEPPPRGPLTDILWADPDPTFGTETENTPLFSFNVERRVSVYFSYEIFEFFMESNHLKCMVRGSQPLTNGILEHPMPVIQNEPNQLSMASLFSAPNFRGKRNKGATLRISEGIYPYTVEQFLWKSPPYCLPNFLNCFTWSLPFVVRKATLLVSDLLAMMDRDTAASDLKAAIQKTQERNQVLAALAHPMRDSFTFGTQKFLAFVEPEKEAESGVSGQPHLGDMLAGHQLPEELSRESKYKVYRQARTRLQTFFCCAKRVDTDMEQHLEER